MKSLVRPVADVRFKSFPNYSYIFSFEDEFDVEWSLNWMERNWSASIGLGALYLITVFGGQKVMSSRSSLGLDRLMVVWNFAMAIFSAVCTLRIYPEFLFSLRDKGFHYSACDNTSFTSNKISAFWYFLFILSKVPELLDTVFIVLRKRKLLFIHYFHHFSTLCFTWFVYRERAAIGRWFAFMNLLVHSFMYAYFGFRALKVKVPRSVAMLITTAQLTQMVLGSVVSVYACVVYLKGTPCAIGTQVGLFAVFQYGIHFYLFLVLFAKAYIFTGRKKDKEN